MAVVIRLQGLPIVAGTMDIRHFFSGLTIPDGGVHIVGGEHGEAFIVFATDEDARLGMMRTGGNIKGSKVSLLLSSKTEMQNMIELSRRRFENPETPAAGTRQPSAAPIPSVQPSANIRTNQPFASVPPSVPSTPETKPAANIPPSFPNSYSSAPTLTTALASLNSGPPPLPALANMPNMPPLPTLPTLPPPSVSALPPVPTVPPVPPMSHLSHMTSLPPFNPSLPPPGGLASGLPLGGPNPMIFNPLNPLASLGIHAHMKAVAAAANPPPAAANPDELYVSVQNLPFSCSEPELREFFRGLGLEAVRMVRDHQGRPSGRAMAKFFSLQDSFEALKRGGGVIGQRFVEIGPGSERQWLSLNDKPLDNEERGRGQNRDRDTRGRSRSPHRQDLCVYLKGLPYEADKKQVKDFFKNLEIIDDSMYIAYGPNGRATGEGFLEFKSEQDYKTALGAHMQYMGSRFIQVHPISRKGMMEKIDHIRKRESEGKMSDGSRAPRICLHITNIPYNVSKKDVRGFLEGLGLYEDSLKVLTDSHGNGLGQAIVQLCSEEDARKAERLHRQKLNGRDAFVHLVTFEQMKEVERNPPPQNKRGQRTQVQTGQPQPGPGPQMAHFGGMGEDFSFIRTPMGGLNSAPFVPPFSAPGNGLAGPPPIPPLAPGLGPGLGPDLSVPPPLVPGLPAPILDPPGFRPNTGAPPPFSQDLRGLVPFDNRKTPTRGGANSSLPRPAGGAPQQGFPPGPDPALRTPPAPGGSSNGAGPTVVKLQNMPFTVTVDEIMDFFYGYQVVPGSVCLQFNDKGLPNGEAMVAFHNHDEAAAAVTDLNDRPIGARKVKISLG